MKLDGLVYVTSTNGYSSGGHRPFHSSSSFGAYVRPMPHCNELSLRILIGAAVREAVVLGYRVTPLFSYHSYHGPVFRILLQMNRGNLSIGWCFTCCSGPSWKGPLHSGAYSTEMVDLAEQWGWVGEGAGTDPEKLLNQTLEESDPRLPLLNQTLEESGCFLLQEGYSASRSHIVPDAIKTDCPIARCIRIAREGAESYTF